MEFNLFHYSKSSMIICYSPRPVKILILKLPKCDKIKTVFYGQLSSNINKFCLLVLDKGMF